MTNEIEELLRQGWQARREGRLDDAKSQFSAAVTLAKEKPGVALAQPLTGLGQIERDLGDGPSALQRYLEAAALYRRHGDVQRIAHTIRHVADIYRQAGQAEAAEPHYREALTLYREDPRTSSLDLANTIRGLALLKSNASAQEDARRLWMEARDLYARADVQAGVVESSERLAVLAG
jgi:tetratricopeptide (TPR) repeat protein